MTLHVTVATTDQHLADMHITRIAEGCDGIHTYAWEWGIMNGTTYIKIDEGEVQHTEINGAFALLDKVIRKTLGEEGEHMSENKLRPIDVEYLFRSIGDELGKVDTQLRSLSQHFGHGTPLSDKIEIAVSNVISARSHVHIVKREALRKAMPHRDHAGEHEDW